MSTEACGETHVNDEVEGFFFNPTYEGLWNRGHVAFLTLRWEETLIYSPDLNTVQQ